MAGSFKTHKGTFTPKFPSKYLGNAGNIVYRSGWERKAMKFFDETKDVINWASEEIVIPYVSPVDNQYHRYFPDFWARVRRPNGEITEYMIEVKPKAQTQPPVAKSNRKTNRYLQEVLTYGVNIAKWKAAVQICKKRGWEFMLMTEDELGWLTIFA